MSGGDGPLFFLGCDPKPYSALLNLGVFYDNRFTEPCTFKTFMF